MAGLRTSIQLVRQGAPVIAGEPNRPISQLAQEILYVWEALQAAQAGAGLFARHVVVDENTVVGSPVYLDPDDRVFKPALATPEVGASSGALRLGAKARWWGVIVAKLDSTLADVALGGYVDLDPAAALGLDAGAAAAGEYWLSGIMAGRITATRPPVAIPVLSYDGNGKCLLRPSSLDSLDRHTHYRFELSVEPAGETTAPDIDETHIITSADANAAGWLPADDDSFSGLAPAGAAFGYNLAQDAALQAAWPPLPLTGAYLEFDRGEAADQAGQGVPLGSTGLCVIDRNGLWWMSNCYGDVPWATATETDFPTSYSDSSDVECPRHLERRLTLWFTRPNFATDLACVTSLRSSDDRLQIVCTGTDTPASVGDLTLNLDLSFSLGEDNATGGLALKSFDEETQVFDRGWVQEGLYAVSDNVALTAAHTRRLVPGDNSSPLLYQGPVGIAVETYPTLELPLLLVRLDGALEEFFEDLMYLGLPAGRLTSLRAKFRVPDDVQYESPQVVLRFWLLGRGTGNLPDLTVTYRRVPRPAEGEAVDLPDTGAEDAAVIDTTAAVTANQYIECTSDAIEVAAGDEVFITVERDASGAGDGYASDLGILRHSAILSAGG